MSSSVHVLLVIDSADQAAVIGKALESALEMRFHVQQFNQLQPALDHLQERHADVLLLDLDLPDSRGLDTFCRAQQQAPTVATIVLCGIHDATVAMRAVRQGAHEFLVKGQFDDDVLVRSIRYAVERAETRRALLESEARYHSMVESLPMNLFRKDLEGRIVFGNQRYCDTLGEPLKRLIGKTDYDLFPAELAAKYVRDDRRVVETGEILEDIEEHVSADGNTIYVHVMKSPIRDAHGNILGTQGLFWDVSDHKRTEAALLEERHLFKSLMDHLPDSIFFKDETGRFLRINKAMAKRLGLDDPDQASGQDAEEFLPQAATEALHRNDQRVIESGHGMVDYEESISWPDGSESYLSTTKMPYRDRHGNIIGLFGIAHDISQLKQVQTQLEHAKDEAEAANRAKSQFLANISHEVRTPMNAILGMTELLMETPLSDEQNEYIALAHKSGQALLGLLNDVLDFSKIEAGQMRLEASEFQIRDCIDDSVRLLAAGAHQKQLELACRVDQRIPKFVVGDSHRLRQILINLLGNAIKFTKQGEVVLEANCSRFSNDQIELDVSVTDTGIGINEDQLSHIFEAFEQGDGSTTRKFGGTGLGLAISHQLVATMGGQLAVESRLGEGSRFRFVIELPIADKAFQTQPSGAQYPDGIRVLVVDDHQPSRRSVIEILQHHRFDAIGAADADEAHGAIRSATESGRPITVAIVDASLADEDGFRLAQQIREDYLVPNILMMLTADRFSSDLARCQQLQLSGYLMKPVKHSEALLLLNAKLNASHDEPGDRDAPTSGLTPTAVALNVLVAEDGEVNRKVVARLLEKQGHSVTPAENGRQAVDAVVAGAFDLVLMDLQMPEMDGLEATAEIRRLEATADERVPIVAVTAHAFESEREKCLAAGMDGYLTKPLSGERLLAAIAEFVTGTATAPPITPSCDSPPTADWETALAAAHGDRQFLHEIIELFMTEYPQLLAELQSAVAAADYDAWDRAAHTLKGSIRHFGAAQAVATAANLEKMGQSQSNVGVQDLLQQFEEELEQLKKQLLQFSERCGART